MLILSITFKNMPQIDCKTINQSTNFRSTEPPDDASSYIQYMYMQADLETALVNLVTSPLLLLK